MPKMEKVYLHNPSSEQISLISISATTAHFHASFFQNRVSTHHFVNTDFYWNRKFIMETQSCRACPLPRLCVELNQAVCVLCVMSHFKQWVRRVGTIQTPMKKHCVLLLTDVNSNMEELSAGINSKKKQTAACTHKSYVSLEHVTTPNISGGCSLRLFVFWTRGRQKQEK